MILRHGSVARLLEFEEEEATLTVYGWPDYPMIMRTAKPDSNIKAKEILSKQDGDQRVFVLMFGDTELSFDITPKSFTVLKDGDQVYCADRHTPGLKVNLSDRKPA